MPIERGLHLSMPCATPGTLTASPKLRAIANTCHSSDTLRRSDAPDEHCACRISQPSFKGARLRSGSLNWVQRASPIQLEPKLIVPESQTPVTQVTLSDTLMLLDERCARRSSQPSFGGVRLRSGSIDWVQRVRRIPREPNPGVP